jgi:perosamine synthetase
MLEPMLTSRLHSLPRFALPYTAADFAAGLLAILRGGPQPEEFGLFDEGQKFWTRSGRQALLLLLRTLDLRPNSGVALPLFTDPSLAKTIVKAGYQPVFIDVDPQHLTMDPESLEAQRGRFSAVIAVHLFGHVADMPAILLAAGDAPVIEDVAHAPLSYLDGRMVGKFGFASFYSFASTKYWPAGGGGLAVVHDLVIAGRMVELTRLLRVPSRFHELRNLIMQGAKAAVFTQSLYGTCGRPLRRWVEDLALLEPHLDENAIQRSHAMVAVRQAKRIAQRVEQQRANSLRLLLQLSDAEDIVLPYETPRARYNYHLFPVLLRNADERAALRHSMWKKFVDTSIIYSNVVNESQRLGYRGRCPVSESVANRLITLPNYAALGDQEIDHVADVFLSSLHDFRSKVSPSRQCNIVSMSG